jgi:tetratricopeptide (TPR) repeat protein
VDDKEWRGSVMDYRHVKLAGLWTRILLLAIFLLACTTFLLWQYGGSWVNRFDDFVVKAYQGYHWKRLNSALVTVNKDSIEGIQLLDELLADLDQIYKLDRLDRVKRKAFEEIVKALNSSGKNIEALAWAENWAEFDERDLFAQVWRAKLMRMSQSTYDEGWQLISEWYQKIPQSNLIANEYAEYLIERGQYADAYLAAHKAFEKQDSLKGQKWQVFWDTGNDFNASQMATVLPEIDTSGRLSILIDVPPEVVRLRIDPPANARINLVAPALYDNNQGQEKKISLLDASLGLSQMMRHGSTLSTTGGDDPYFYWDMSGMQLSGGKLFFVCDIEETLPGVMAKIFSQSVHEGVVDALMERQEIKSAKQFQDLAGKQHNTDNAMKFEGAFFEVFWKKSGENFSQKRKVRTQINGLVEDGAYRYEVTLPIGAHVEKLRIDLPDLLGAKFKFEAVELVGHKWSHQVDLSKVDDGLSHMIARQSGSFEVMGSDPYFIFEVSPKGRVIEAVVVRGGVL